MDFNVGQTVILNRGQYVSPAAYGRTHEVNKNTSGEIRRVATRKVLVAFPRVTGWVLKDDVQDPDPNAPKPRRVGEAPEGMIAIDDPRIDWIWKDAAVIADREGYCSYYDSIVNKLGAPGRERDFNVKATVNGIVGTFSVKARSRREAEARINQTLNVNDSAIGE